MSCRIKTSHHVSLVRRAYDLAEMFFCAVIIVHVHFHENLTTKEKKNIYIGIPLNYELQPKPEQFLIFFILKSRS